MENKLNIKEYLDKDEQKDLLRLLTAGSVDDGKSTLIGRLLFDSKKLYEDQLAALERDSKRVGNAGDHIDYALLCDGLKAEREQGITIDVAYRYFSTNNRKFIIADTPGHEQYTRNMITGGSTANLAIILVDARLGVITQTCRHTFLVSLLGIKHVVLAVNKMDLVGFSEERFNEIVTEYKKFVGPLGIPDVTCIPLSALDGDNVVQKSERTPWYKGTSLLELLETVSIENDHNLTDFRFPVQYVLRPNLDFRGFCPDWHCIQHITVLGIASFVMSFTDMLVQVACNSMLRGFGGDLYISVMTVLNSVRQIAQTPVLAIADGASTAISYNYGAGLYKRTRDAIRFMTHDCYRVHHACLDAGLSLSCPVHPHFQSGRGTGRGGCSGAAHLLFRLCDDGVPVFRSEYVPRVGPGEIRGVLLSLAQGVHCCAPDFAAAVLLESRRERRICSRAGVQLHRRSGVLLDHAACGDAGA